MVQRVATVAFEGIEARNVTVQVQVAPGLPAFNVVGLGDKAVSESLERVPAAIGANAAGKGLICPAACGPEAAWASPEMAIVAPSSLIQLANHLKGTQVLLRPQPKVRASEETALDLRDIRGQESAKRALE